MRVRQLLSVFLPALLLIGGIVGCGSLADDIEGEEPVPTFSTTPGTGGARPRQTLLPADCTEVLGGASMSALLGQPVDSVEGRAVLGQPAPSVGRLERVTCVYERARSRGLTDVAMNLSAYTSQAAADAQLTTNVAAERNEAAMTEEFRIGTARAALFAERGKTVLMVTSGRSSATITLRAGLVADSATRQVLVDLAQRVLPNLAPEPAGSAPPAQPRGPSRASSGEPR